MLKRGPTRKVSMKGGVVLPIGWRIAYHIPYGTLVDTFVNLKTEKVTLKKGDIVIRKVK